MSMKTEKIWTLKSPEGLQGVGARVLLWAARGLSLEMKDAVTWQRHQGCSPGWEAGAEGWEVFRHK